MIFSLIGGQWNAVEIIDDVSGFPRSTASDEQSCDNDSLVSVIKEKQQGRRKGEWDVKDAGKAGRAPHLRCPGGSGDGRVMELTPSDSS